MCVYVSVCECVQYLFTLQLNNASYVTMKTVQHKRTVCSGNEICMLLARRVTYDAASILSIKRKFISAISFVSWGIQSVGPAFKSIPA